MAFRDNFDEPIVIVALQAQEQVDDLLRHEENFSRVHRSVHHASNELTARCAFTSNGFYQRSFNRLHFRKNKISEEKIHSNKSLTIAIKSKLKITNNFAKFILLMCKLEMI